LVNLPYRDASFDLVVASEVLEHVPAIRAALAEIKRVLRSGGKVAMTVPIESRTALHVHSLKDGDDLAVLCLEAGLAIRRLETHRLPGFGDDWKHVFLLAESEADARHEYAIDRQAASALGATCCHVDTQGRAMEPRPEPDQSLTLCRS
jgi:SAM-dependent methyltransferase